MDFKTIQEVVKAMPFNDDYFQESHYHQYGGSESSQANNIQKFVTAYRDLKFGWNFIRFLLRTGNEFPPELMSYEYLYRAYKFEKHGTNDPDIMMAISFDHPSHDYFSTLLQSFLLVEDIDIDYIVKKTSFSKSTILAFEGLFFNVLSRNEEHAWLASQVYPSTRFVEMKADYATKECFSKLLMRAGYNSGLEHVEYFSGLRNDLLTTGDMVNAASKMENALMINGYMLATSGYLNTQGSSGIHHARTLIAAEKQGGSPEAGNEDLGLISMGESLLGELGHYGENVATERLEARKQLHGA